MSTLFKKESLRENWLFLKRWFMNPRQLGALFPSSRSLASAMASCALDELGEKEWIVELGAGTGRFTQALIEAGLPEDRLICIELDPTLCQYLTEKFPRTLVVSGNACHLPRLMAPYEGREIGVVLSGLPMLNFPFLIQQEILKGCFQIMKPGGRLLQFTYSPFSSIDTARFSLEKKRCRWVVGNVPPASIWCYTQR